MLRGFTMLRDRSENGYARGLRTGTTLRDRMARHLFIVSRHHVRLYDYLLERFQDDTNVQVVLDRRATAERRTAERESEDRRQSRAADDDLKLRSHVIVTRDE